MFSVGYRGGVPRAEYAGALAVELVVFMCGFQL